MTDRKITSFTINLAGALTTDAVGAPEYLNRISSGGSGASEGQGSSDEVGAAGGVGACVGVGVGVGAGSEQSQSSSGPAMLSSARL